jgi:4-amino-4-deoxy-L-arabinose transferase-like glycosyltransferase
LALSALVVVSAAVRTWAASRHVSPAYFPDEYLYSELSRSIATSGHAYVRGAPSHFAPLLAPLVTAPAWLFGSVSAGYHAAQAINAVFVSLAAVPVFVLARTLRLGRPYALAAAALALVLPGLLYSSFMLSEPIAYPFVLAAVATGVRALDRPTWRTIALFLGFVVLASFARLQFAVLLPCFLVALVGMLAREQRVKITLRRHWRSAVALVLATVALAAAGPARSTGYYPSFLHVGINVGNTLSSLGLNALILAIGTGLVLLPGSILGAVAAIERPRIRAELGFALLTVTVTVALLLQASIYGDTHVAQTRYTFYIVPLWVISFLLYAQRGWPRRRAVALLTLGLLTAALTTPLTTAAIGQGKIHAPELFAVGQIEQSFNNNAGKTSSLFFIALLVGAVLTTGAAWARPKVATIVALTFAVACMCVLSVAAYGFDSTNTKSVRAAFAGSNPSWVDELHLGPVQMVITPNGLMTDSLEQMFWNRSVDRAVLLPGAKPTDSLPAGKGTVTGDGTLLVNGRQVTGPALIDQYSTSVQVRGAARLGSDPSSVLYRPSGALKFKLVAIGQYDQHWLGQRGAFLIWPDAVGGPVAGQVVLRLSLPAGARTIRMQFRGKHVLRNLTVAAGSRRTVRIPVCGTGPVELTFAAMWSGRIGDGRTVSAGSQPPVFERNAQACAVGSKP